MPEDKCDIGRFEFILIFHKLNQSCTLVSCFLRLFVAVIMSELDNIMAVSPAKAARMLFDCVRSVVNML